MNFITDYNKSNELKFTKTFVPMTPSIDKDKYREAIDGVTKQYGNSKLESDKVTLRNILSSINGLKEEEKDGEISSQEASRSLKALIAKHIGGRRKTSRRLKSRKTRRNRK